MKKDKKMNEETLGGRLKGYEADYEIEIEPKDHIVCRIDGHKFSKFTKGFNKPFDEILSKSMELTTIDLVDHFNAVTGYTQSDEISLIIPSLLTSEKHKGVNAPTWKHEYSGRVQKMSSLIAAFTTMRFNLHLDVELKKSIINTPLFETHEYRAKEELEKYWEMVSNKVGKAWFDCRIFGVKDDYEAFNSILWRARDAEKNSRSMFAQAHCSHKELQGMTGEEQVQYCLNKTGLDWNEIDERYKYGILIKKENYIKEVQIHLTGRHVEMKEQFKNTPSEVQRTRIISWAEHLVFSDSNVQMVMAKIKGKQN